MKYLSGKSSKNKSQSLLIDVFSDRKVIISLIILAISFFPTDIVLSNVLFKRLSSNFTSSNITSAKEITVQNPDVDEYAFDLLTPAGKEIFDSTIEFIDLQQTNDYYSFAQPLKCASNVSEVLYGANYHVPSFLYDSVSGIIQYVQSIQGKVYTLPLYNGTNKQELIDYINKNFPQGKIPTGALIAGCAHPQCQSVIQSKAHIGIVGDNDHQGNLLVYHNNWFRPNIVSGERNRYMPEVYNFYHQQRLRQWMPTPWVKITRDSQGYVNDLVTILPDIDDLDPFNGEYYIKIILVPDLLDDINNNRVLNTHTLLIDSNVHRFDIEDLPNKDFVYCKSKKPLRLLIPRLSAEGVPDNDLILSLSSKDHVTSFFNSNFEFIILDKKQISRNTWYSIKVYDLGKFWGGETNPIWIKARNTKCKTNYRWNL